MSMRFSSPTRRGQKKDLIDQFNATPSLSQLSTQSSDDIPVCQEPEDEHSLVADYFRFLSNINPELTKSILDVNNEEHGDGDEGVVSLLTVLRSTRRAIRSGFSSTELGKRYQSEAGAKADEDNLLHVLNALQKTREAIRSGLSEGFRFRMEESERKKLSSEAEITEREVKRILSESGSAKSKPSVDSATSSQPTTKNEASQLVRATRQPSNVPRPRNNTGLEIRGISTVGVEEMFHPVRSRVRSDDASPISTTIVCHTQEDMGDGVISVLTMPAGNGDDYYYEGRCRSHDDDDYDDKIERMRQKRAFEERANRAQTPQRVRAGRPLHHMGENPLTVYAEEMGAYGRSDDREASPRKSEKFRRFLKEKQDRIVGLRLEDERVLRTKPHPATKSAKLQSALRARHAGRIHPGKAPGRHDDYTNNNRDLHTSRGLSSPSKPMPMPVPPSAGRLHLDCPSMDAVKMRRSRAWSKGHRDGGEGGPAESCAANGGGVGAGNDHTAWINDVRRIRQDRRRDLMTKSRQTMEAEMRVISRSPSPVESDSLILLSTSSSGSESSRAVPIYRSIVRMRVPFTR